MKDFVNVVESYLDSMIGKAVEAKYYNSDKICGVLRSYEVNPFNASEVTVVINQVLYNITDIGLKRYTNVTAYDMAG